MKRGLKGMSARTAELPQTYLTPAEILAQVHITEDRARLHESDLPLHAQTALALARAQGLRPACLYWPDGAFVICLLQASGEMPSANYIVNAYQACRRVGGEFRTNGSRHEKG